jgi:hypothetical protein
VQVGSFGVVSADVSRNYGAVISTLLVMERPRFFQHYPSTRSEKLLAEIATASHFMTDPTEHHSMCTVHCLNRIPYNCVVHSRHNDLSHNDIHNIAMRFPARIGV